MRRSIPEVIDMIKRFLLGDFFMVLVIVLVGTASFGLGRLSVKEERREPVRIEYPNVSNTTPVSSDTQNTLKKPASEEYFVGSKNGNKYHYPWCSGAKRIKLENLVRFATQAEAENAGYTPAANCKGL